jgi:hypothetical protein
MVRLRGGWSRPADPAPGGYDDEHGYEAEYGDAAGYEAVEAEIVDLTEEPNASDDARAIRSACEAIERYIAPYIEHVRGDVPAAEAFRLAEARALLDEALALLA